MYWLNRQTGNRRLYSTFSRPTGRQSNVEDLIIRKKTKKRLIDSVVILNTAIVAYYLLIRLNMLLILQSTWRPVGREKVL